MKRLLFFLFLFSLLPIGAQTIVYDTIRVSPGDERNIHLNRSRKTGAASEPSRKKSVSAGKQAAAFSRSKLRFGANLGLSVSLNYTNLGIGPQIGYQFNKYFMAGAGVKYYYTRTRTVEYGIKSNLLGINMFGYLYPVRFITLFAQPEINYIRSTLTPWSAREKITNRGFVPSLVAGAGFRLGGSHVTLNYDLVQHANSPHPEGFFLGVSAFF
ncbi:MAG: porin family protein [Proteiniphilum sp.]|jgi:hypothetical protein|nr:porin family protein [Proteiniphilum sp.]